MFMNWFFTLTIRYQVSGIKLKNNLNLNTKTYLRIFLLGLITCLSLSYYTKFNYLPVTNFILTRILKKR